MHPSDESENAPAIEMPKYKSHKEVWALKIKWVEGTRLTFEEPGYAPITVPREMFARVVPTAGWYYVVYDYGYKSFSPPKAFEEGYSPVSGKPFQLSGRQAEQEIERLNDELQKR